ncbi:hypothetical protein MMPV_006487 [Pyropia vietnamensis]
MRLMAGAALVVASAAAGGGGSGDGGTPEPPNANTTETAAGITAAATAAGTTSGGASGGGGSGSGGGDGADAVGADAGGGDEKAAVLDAADTAGRRELWQSIAAARSALAIALRAERYLDAARLRNEVNALLSRDPWEVAKAAMDAAVAREAYAEAAAARDALAAIPPPPSMESLSRPAGSKRRGAGGDKGRPGDRDGLRGLTEADVDVACDAISSGVRVRVEAFFLPERSDVTPLEGAGAQGDGKGDDAGAGVVAGRGRSRERSFVFGYKVRLTNTTSGAVQVVGRHWKIENTAGVINEVRGVGVVGKQPVLMPGETFEYVAEDVFRGNPRDILGRLERMGAGKSSGANSRSGVGMGDERFRRPQPMLFMLGAPRSLIADEEVAAWNGDWPVCL